MNTIEAIAVSIVSALIVSLLVYIYCRYRWRRSQRALQWFYAKRVDRSAALAEKVREQLFQKSFALRRSLEFSTLELSAPTVTAEARKQISRSLSLAETFNLALEQISDDLSAPFIEDSLPLALQHFLKRWRDAESETSEILLILDLPPDWPWQQTVRHRLLLWCIGECADIWRADVGSASPQVLELMLSQNRGIAKLRLIFKGQLLQEASALTIKRDLKAGDLNADELAYIRQVFELLMPGRCQLKHHRMQLVGEFSWSVADDDTDLNNTDLKTPTC